PLAVAQLRLVRSMARILVLALLLCSCATPRPATTVPVAISSLAIYAPLPEYPLGARERHASGRGYFVLHVDRASGAVNSLEVRRSTSDRALDAAASSALRQWRFKGGGVLPTRHDPRTTKESLIGVPVTFALSA